VFLTRGELIATKVLLSGTVTKYGTTFIAPFKKDCLTFSKPLDRIFAFNENLGVLSVLQKPKSLNVKELRRVPEESCGSIAVIVDLLDFCTDYTITIVDH
jgi:hypothetical protein